MKTWLKFARLKSAFFASILSLLFSLTTPQLEAQFLNKYTPTHYSIDNGLMGNWVTQVAQDGNGFMWFTDNFSIIRFDGNEFKYYNHNKEDSLMIIGPDAIGKIVIDQKGNLWINNLETVSGALNSSKSLLKYDLAQDGFILYKPKVSSFIRSLTPESDTLIWLGSITEGLYLFNTVTDETFNFPNEIEGKEFYNLNNHIRSIQDKKDHLILGTNNGLWLFDKETRTYSRSKIIPGIFHTGMLAIDRHGWIVRWRPDSVFKIDNNFKVVKKIGSSNTRLITFDQQGNILAIRNPIGTYQRVFLRSVDDIETEIPFNTSNEESAFGANDCAFDKEGNIWITSAHGITKFTRLSIPYEAIEIQDEFNDGLVTVVDINRSKTAVFHSINNYIATASIPFKKSTIRDFNFKRKYDSYANLNASFRGKNNLWISAWHRGVLKIPIDSINNRLSENGAMFLEPNQSNLYSLSSTYAWSVYEDNEGFLWIGHFDKGIDKFNIRMPYGSEGSVQRFRHDPLNQESLSSDLIQSIISDDEGTILIGTGAGIDQFRAGKFKRLLNTGERMFLKKMNNGEILAWSISNSVYKAYKDDTSYQFKKLNLENIGLINDINSDDRGRLWITTSLGLFMYEPELSQLCRLFHEPALKNGFTMTKISNEQYFITKADHLISFNPNAFNMDSISVNVVLTILKINNKAVDRHTPGITKVIKENITTAKEIILNHLNNDFELEFSGLSFISPGSILYKYKLDGYDNEWIYTDAKKRTATYTNLDPGTYTFRVKASNHHGVWSDNERTLKVLILPPPWRTWWAYTGYGLIVLGLLYWARSNIVKQERLYANLQLAKVEQEKEHFELERAKEVDKIKTSFFNNISHEFRTPLTLIKGPVQDLLEKYTSDPKTQQKLKMVQRNSDLLLKLINQLLDLAKLESGTLNVEKSEGDLYSFIRAIASSFSSFAAQKNVTVKLDVSTDSCYANFDKDKLETILINLINNAIKFTQPNGSVTVSAMMEETAEAQSRKGSLTIKVIDTGIGISEENLNKIFERFHQESEAHKEVGTGIGLSLVKEIVTLLGGTITVNSKPSEGSEFIVTMPIEIAECGKQNGASCQSEQTCKS